MDIQYSAKRYFIIAFKKYTRNDYKIMAKKYNPSIRELLSDYIAIHEDINGNGVQDKLERSREDLLGALKFFIRNNILYESVYKVDLNALIDQIEKLEKNDGNRLLQFTRINNTCKSILKKISNDNIYALIIFLVKGYKSFIEMDRALECLINELIYDGYSLKYLDSWYNNNINTRDINERDVDSILESFITLKKGQETFKYYLSVLDSSKIVESELFIDFNMKLKKEDYEQLTMIATESGEDIKNYLQKSLDYPIFSVQIQTMDVYKGLEMVVNTIDSYFQMIRYVSDEKKNILLDKVICQTEGSKFEKMRIESFDDKILFSNIENREREDIVDFLKYRTRTYEGQIKSDEIPNLQRALNIVKNQQGQQQENRIINLWAVLEYILTFHEGLSIISKVREVVPKIICLYTIKDKLNIFWNRISKYKNSGHEIVDEFLCKCKKDDEEEFYDLDKIIEIVKDKGERLINDFSFNDLIKREIAEIGELISNPKNLMKYILNKHDEITNDLIRIYRIRNTLIHSGRRIKTNLIFDSLRLYQYNNHLLGLVIYYKNKNPYSTITEILNSVDFTYSEYIRNLKDAKPSPKEICKPKYLFIG